MGFWSSLGTAAGGIGGFVVGGPAGAALGAAGGAALGGGIDDLSSASTTPQTGFNYDVTKADPNAPVTPDQNNVLGASQGYVSPETAALVAGGVNQTNQTGAAHVQQGDATAALEKALLAAGYNAADAAAQARFFAANPAALQEFIRSGGVRGGTGGITDPALAAAAANLANANASVATAAQAKSDYDARLAASRGVDSSDLSAYARGAEGALGRSAAQMGGITIDQRGLNHELDQADASYGAIGQTAARQGDLATTLINDDTGAGQQKFVDRLNNDMTGAAPSLAELQLREGEAGAIRSQLAMAAAANPMNYAAAARNAQMNASNIDQATNMQAAQARADEYARAEGMLGSALAQQRAGTLASRTAGGQVLSQAQAGQVAGGQLALGAGHEAAGAATAQAGIDYQVAGANLNSGIQQQQLNQSLYGQNLAAYQARQEAIRQQQNQNVTNQIAGANINAGIAGQNLGAQTAANNTRVAVADREIALGSAAVKAAGTFGANQYAQPKKQEEDQAA